MYQAINLQAADLFCLVNTTIVFLSVLPGTDLYNCWVINRQSKNLAGCMFGTFS